MVCRPGVERFVLWCPRRGNGVGGERRPVSLDADGLSPSRVRHLTGQFPSPPPIGAVESSVAPAAGLSGRRRLSAASWLVEVVVTTCRSALVCQASCSIPGPRCVRLTRLIPGNTKGRNERDRARPLQPWRTHHKSPVSGDFPRPSRQQGNPSPTACLSLSRGRAERRPTRTGPVYWTIPIRATHLARISAESAKGLDEGVRPRFWRRRGSSFGTWEFHRHSGRPSARARTAV